MVRRSCTDWELLEYIGHKSGISCTDLANHYSITRQAMHQRLTPMVRKGFLYKEEGSGRRAGLYYVKRNKPWKRRGIT
jgi:DNA-binding MarR family transcriptional regulator